MPPPMPLIPRSLIPSEPVRSGGGVSFIKLKDLKNKQDRDLEDIHTNCSTPGNVRFSDERTFKTMIMGEQK